MAQTIQVKANIQELSKHLNEIIFKASEQALAENRVFTIALSGGSLAKQLTADTSTKHKTKHWHVVFADERCVPLDHADSNYGLFVDMFKNWGIERHQILTIDPLLVNDPPKAAQRYQQELEKIQGFPVLDVVLLGMGPDGHTCSLFPGHPLLEEKTLAVASIQDSPKPPPNRITLTYPIVNGARNVVFACTGEGKAPVLHEIFDLKKDYPAGRVQPKGNLVWLVDAPAAKDIASLKSTL